MANRTRKNRCNEAGGGDLPSLHERITQRIINQLKAGTPPWVKPWNCKALFGMPRNYVSGRPYSGINVLLTWLAAFEHGFKDTHYWSYPDLVALPHKACLDKSLSKRACGQAFADPT